jgi:hypothetical protein
VSDTARRKMPAGLAVDRAVRKIGSLPPQAHCSAVYGRDSTKWRTRVVNRSGSLFHSMP